MVDLEPMKLPAAAATQPRAEGERKCLNSELWHACAGPLVCLPTVGSRVVYFPQGHSEQLAVSTQKEADARIPNYSSLPPQLICQLHDVILHVETETDEVYCQMTLQPVSGQEQESILVSDIGSQNRQPNNFFCKTLTASDTSTHGGFSIPRRAAEKVFPPLDFSQQPPAQELIARDLHDNEWKFRHIYRGQPKRHLLTTGWSVFVSAKRLTAGDSVIFIRNDKGQLLLGIRRATRPQTVMPSSVLSSDSMHIGVLAAAAYAAATNRRFTVFYNPRASPSEFVIPFSKYEKAICHTRVSVGMRFRMLFETEESSVRRYMGTVTGVSDLDPVRWPNSQWRSIKVGWDESTAGERQKRVSVWEIEPLTTFLVYPPPSTWRFKRPWPEAIDASLLEGDHELESLKRPSILPSSQSSDSSKAAQGMELNTSGHIPPKFESTAETDVYAALGAAALREIFPSKQLQFLQQPVQADHMLYNALSQPQQLSLSMFGPHQHMQSSLPQAQSPLLSQMVGQQSLPHPAQHEKQSGLHQQQSHLLGLPLQHQIQQTPSQHSSLPRSQCFAQSLQLPQVQEQDQQQHCHPLLQQWQCQQEHYQVPNYQQEQQQRDQREEQRQPEEQHQPPQYPQVQQRQQQQQLLQPHQHQQQPHYLQQQQQQQKLQPHHHHHHRQQQQQQQQLQQQTQQQQQQQQLQQQTQQQQQYQVQLQQQHYQLRPPSTHPDQQHQNRSSSSSNASSSINQVAISQSKVHSSSSLLTPQSTASSIVSSAETHIPFQLQSILNSLASDNFSQLSTVPIIEPILQQHIAASSGSELRQESVIPASWNCGENPQLSGESHLELIYTTRTANRSPQMDQHMQPNFPSMPLHASPFNLKDYSQGQAALRSDLQRQILGGVSGDLSSMGMLASMPSENKCYGDNVEVHSPSISQLIQGQSIMDFPISSELIDGSLDDGLLQDVPALTQVNPPMRTYTKVCKEGSVGRSLDVTRYKSYAELRAALASMFGLEVLEDPTSGWQLVFQDKENDWLLLGDDPWEQFVRNVRHIRILSPLEAYQKGIGLQTGYQPMERQTSTSSDGGTTQQDSRNPSSVITSAYSFDY